jgi:hypothetical protein
MTSGTALRAAVTGLIMQAAAEEEMLLSSAPREEQGGPDHWAAIPVIAHNSEFRQQQVIRLEAVRAGTTPPGFPEIDHQSTRGVPVLCCSDRRGSYQAEQAVSHPAHRWVGCGL